MDEWPQTPAILFEEGVDLPLSFLFVGRVVHGVILLTCTAQRLHDFPFFLKPT